MGCAQLSPRSPRSTLFPYTTLFRSHNHLLRSSPQTIYMHVRGQGDPARIATTLHSALALSRTPLAAPAAAAPQPALDLDTDRKSTRLNSTHRCISYAVVCLKKTTDN